MARIMIADDEEHIRVLLGRVLEQSGHSVLVARDGREALQILERQLPDLAILDITMPHASGIDICRHVRHTLRTAHIPILFLTGREHISAKIESFEAGADDYVTKPFNPNELNVRVNALLRYVSAREHETLKLGDLSVALDRHCVEKGGKPIDLTPVEYELLAFLAQRKGQVFQAEILLQQVWGYPPGTGSPSLVRMHVLNLRRKIEQDPLHPTYLVTVPRHGYSLRSPD